MCSGRYIKQMRFKEHYLIEKKTYPEYYETAVVRAWNERTIRKDIKPFIDDVVSQLKSINLTGKARQLGRENQPISKEWTKHDPIRKTDAPKTDLIIGTHKISMKLKPNAMLMSGSKKEAQATLMSVLDRIKDPSNLDSMVDIVKNEFEQFKRGISPKGTVKDVLKKKGTDENVEKLNELHKTITKHLIDLLNNDDRVGIGFVKEAMSGYIKFGKKSEGSADYVLSFTKKGTDVSLNSIQDKSFVKKIVKSTKCSITFKSNKQTKGYAYWSTMKLDWTDFKESLQDTYDGQLLTEGIIGDVISKVKNFFAEMFKKIYKFISESVQNFLQFFGLTPEVKFNNNVSF